MDIKEIQRFFNNFLHRVMFWIQMHFCAASDGLDIDFINQSFEIQLLKVKVTFENFIFFIHLQFAKKVKIYNVYQNLNIN